MSYCAISFSTSTPKDAVIIQNKKVCDQHLIYCLMEQLRFSGGLQSPPGGVGTVWKVCDGIITQSIMLN